MAVWSIPRTPSLPIADLGAILEKLNAALPLVEDFASFARKQPPSPQRKKRRWAPIEPELLPETKEAVQKLYTAPQLHHTRQATLELGAIPVARVEAPSPPPLRDPWLYDRGSAFAAVGALYKPEHLAYHCKKCALRIPLEQVDDHLDRHFKENREKRLRKQEGVVEFRGWYAAVTENNHVEENADSGKVHDLPLQKCRQGDSITHQVCSICHQQMGIAYYDEEEDDWMVSDCVELQSGEMVHDSCHRLQKD